MAVMDAMGHEKIDTTRLYNHPGTKQIRDAIERRNQLVQQESHILSHIVLGDCVTGWCK